MKKPINAGKANLDSFLVIILFTILTLADASAPISGIFNVSIYGNQLFAETGYQGIYFSEDRGLTWTDCSTTSKCNSADVISITSNFVSVPESNIQYRITEAGKIEVSNDAGLTWERLAGGKYSSDVGEYYQLQSRVNAIVMNPGANDVQYDLVSGNVLFAMGLQGVLVITPDGEIIQVGVGDNQPANLNDPMVFISIIFPFLLLAMAFIAVCYGTLITLSRYFWYWVLNLAALIVLGYIALGFPELFSGYGIVFGIPALAVFAVLVILLLVKSESTLKKLGLKNKHYKINLLKKVMPGGLAYFLCYLLWYLGIIPKRDWALYISLAVTVGWFIYCVIQSYKWNNQPMDAA